MGKIDKILIANRGEIAVRIIRTCRSEQIGTVAVYSATDGEDCMHARLADEAVELSGEGLGDTYLNGGLIIDMAKKSGAAAIHPGYGFLSENHHFARECGKAGIVFIGPHAGAIEQMGNKVRAKELVRSLGMPVLDFRTGTAEELAVSVKELKWPVLVKPAAGGGGKGMRIVSGKHGLDDALETAEREALRYFGDPRLYVEQYIPDARHLEIQVLADHSGQVVHLFERECSVQRRYQKVIEESPAPGLGGKQRDAMSEAAVRIAQAMGYTSAGTVEFLLDGRGNFYFLEMNTRIQVEHPVTEMVTGIDIVHQQIRIASGLPISFGQDDISQVGHAIEARICCEDPLNGFTPAPGPIHYYAVPASEGLRIDSGVDGPDTVHPEYDPLVCKAIAHGKDRTQALRRLDTALGGIHIHGPVTNLSFLRAVLAEPLFRNGSYYTGFIDERKEQLRKTVVDSREQADRNLLAGAAILARTRCHLNGKNKEESVWNSLGYWRSVMRPVFVIDGQIVETNVDYFGPGEIAFRCGNRKISMPYRTEGNRIILGAGSEQELHCSGPVDGELFLSISGLHFGIGLTDHLPSGSPLILSGKKGEHFNNTVVSPMHGRIVRIAVREEDRVSAGDLLFVVDSMKIENKVNATRSGTVRRILVRTGEQIKHNGPAMIIN